MYFLVDIQWERLASLPRKLLHLMAQSGLGLPVPEAVAGQTGSFISRDRWFGVQWVMGGLGSIVFSQKWS